MLRESRADPSWGWWVGKKKASWRPLAASSEDMAGTAAATGRVVVVLTILWDRCGPPSPIHWIAFRQGVIRTPYRTGEGDSAPERPAAPLGMRALPMAVDRAFARDGGASRPISGFSELESVVHKRRVES